MNKKKQERNRLHRAHLNAEIEAAIEAGKAGTPSPATSVHRWTEEERREIRAGYHDGRHYQPPFQRAVQLLCPWENSEADPIKDILGRTA